MHFLSTEQNLPILNEQEEFIHNNCIDQLCLVKCIVDGVLKSFIIRMVILLNQYMKHLVVDAYSLY